MKQLGLALFIILCQAHLYGTEPPIETVPLKGIQAFTVLTRATPGALDQALKEALVKELRPHGSIITLETGDTFSKNFNAAMSEATFLTLFIDSTIQEQAGSSPLAFKVACQISLRVLAGYKKQTLEECSPHMIWIQEATIEFLPDGKTLTNRSIEAMQLLAKQFIEQYVQSNPKTKPTFYII